MKLHRKDRYTNRKEKIYGKLSYYGIFSHDKRRNGATRIPGKVRPPLGVIYVNDKKR